MAKAFLFQTIKTTILSILVFAFPLFFLPITQEYFSINKLYLMAFGALALILVSGVEFLMTKKLAWQKRPFDGTVFLFLVTVALSIIIVSPNKVQAVFNPSFGFAAVFVLAIFYFYLSRASGEEKRNYLNLLNLAIFVLSLVAIMFFFQPFKNINLPYNFLFLKNVIFTPAGSQYELLILLGFAIAYGLAKVIGSKQTGDSPGKTVFNSVLLIFNVAAFSLTLYSFIKQPQFQPPLRLSWYAAVETLKNPVTALFGVGVDNLSVIYSRVKDVGYNQSPLWQVPTFNVSSSTLLHIWTEAGLFGLAAFLLLATQLTNIVLKGTAGARDKSALALAVVLGLAVLGVLPTLTIFFLIFFVLGIADAATGEPEPHTSIYDLSGLMPVYLGTAIIAFLFVGVVGYLFGVSYTAELYFKRSLDGFLSNNAKDLYDNQRQAIITNPYIERFRTNFAQTNLLIANNIASKKQEEITETDRQTIAQAIQAAIAEAKAGVALNQEKASAWANLAEVYKNILNVAQGADVWTVSAYQRAIILDPQNPIYRLNLGGVYYSLGGYDNAIRFFEQAVGLKSDWANAHYNLAWAHFQKEQYQQAVSEMQNALYLLDPKANEADYKKAMADLEEFKKKLPQAQEEGQTEKEPSELKLPTPPPATMEPKIKLPEEASPEAE